MYTYKVPATSLIYSDSVYIENIFGRIERGSQGNRNGTV